MTFKTKFYDNLVAIDKDRQVISDSIFGDDIH